MKNSKYVVLRIEKDHDPIVVFNGSDREEVQDVFESNQAEILSTLSEDRLYLYFGGIGKPCRSWDWKQATGQERVKALGLKSFDFAVALEIATEIFKLTGLNVSGHIVTQYDSVFGELMAISPPGKQALDSYYQEKN